jgi:anti-sigma B factor antagonist
MYRTVSMRGGQLVIVGLSDEIRDTMEMTGFLDFFLLAASLEEAFAQVHHATIDHAGAR